MILEKVWHTKIDIYLSTEEEGSNITKSGMCLPYVPAIKEDFYNLATPNKACNGVCR
jgi:hypothetical protein